MLTDSELDPRVIAHCRALLEELGWDGDPAGLEEGGADSGDHAGHVAPGPHLELGEYAGDDWRNS